MSLEVFALRLLAALLLGALVGLERQRRNGLAGARTNALVSVGAAQFVMLTPLLGGDPTRIAAQVVSGIGFLGAGVILRDGNMSVRGLNTAATLWGSAAIGSLAGSGHFPEAFAGSLAVLCANVVLREVARRFERPGGVEGAQPAPEADDEVRYRLSFTCAASEEMTAREAAVRLLDAGAFRLLALEAEEWQGERLKLAAEVQCAGRQDELLEAAVRSLGAGGLARALSWRVLSE